MTIAVIDGQGGRIGALLIEAMRRAGIGAPHRVLALGTNALATSAMLRAGADQGATGANPIVVACRGADLIVGPIGIVIADSLTGEVCGEILFGLVEAGGAHEEDEEQEDDVDHRRQIQFNRRISFAKFF